MWKLKNKYSNISDQLAEVSTALEKTQKAIEYESELKARLKRR